MVHRPIFYNGETAKIAYNNLKYQRNDGCIEVLHCFYCF